MRLPESKIKQAILHPEKMVREEALSYFADCYSRDTEVMLLAIKAIETYGHDNAFQGLHDLTKLAQTEATVEWAIRELHREKDKTEEHDSYFFRLSNLLGSADIRLVAPRADEILQAPGFAKAFVPAFRERLQLATWDAGQCWEELERFCAEAIRKQDPSEANIDRANRVVEALARQGEKHIVRILDLLGQDVKDFDTDPMVWLEDFLVRLAGVMRLESAIPSIVKKLHLCGEVLSEECVEALSKIGTDAAVEAITEGWLEAVWDYRLYASSALEKIHSDTTARKCLELLPQDKDVGIRTNLADALLSQFADEGIEPVREMVQRRAYDSMVSDLMRKLVAVSTVLDVTFPEYPIWKREAEERWAKQERRMKEMEAFIYAPQEPALPAKPAPVMEREPFPERNLTPILRTEKKVGRNDPCPCGSGKKYKKCCMNRDRE